MKPQKSKILVVENESLVAIDIQESLQSFGYEVVAIASCGRTALAQVEKTRPQLVIMDIMLEGEMDGVETAIAIRSRFNIPVIFLTAFTAQDLLARAKVAQSYGYIVKPFADRELMANVEMALYKHQQEALFLRNHDWFANTLANLDDAIVLIDAYKNIVFLNPHAMELTGWSEEAVGSPLQKVLPIDDAKTKDEIDSLVSEVLSECATVSFKAKTRLIRKDGGKIHIDGSITPVTKPDGLILGAVLVFQKVPDDAQAGKPQDSKAGEKKEEDIPGHREKTPESIMSVSSEGTIDSFNLGAERVFGIKSAEIIGKKIETLLPKPFQTVKNEGSSIPIHQVINKMRIRERSLFIGLLYNQILHHHKK